MHGLLTEDWADGTYSFRLAQAQWIELQDKLDLGPLELYMRLMNHTWRVQYLREVIRVALIGGGTDPGTALRLTRTYVEERPLLESVPLALRIVSASLSVPEGASKAGEPEAATTSSSVSMPLPSTPTVQ
jgi:hypothetical protein